MNVLNSNMTKLLDKLYNLRGEDSVVLKTIEEEKDSAVETKEKTSTLKKELQEKINDLTSEGKVLADEGEKLTKALETINKDEFSTVIDHLKIDFDPEAIRNKIETSLPVTLDRVANEKKDAEERLVKVEDEMTDAITRIEELGIRKDEAVANQERLNKYFDLALSSNINITRDEITSLLAKFDFSDEEQREAAKLLMFPEDGLFEYEDARSDKPVSDKSITEIIKEAKEDAPIVEEAPVVEEPSISVPLINEEVKEEGLTNDNVVELLNILGFNAMDFSSDAINALVQKNNKALYEENVKCANTLGISQELFINNPELLYDEEFTSKVNELLKIGKEANDIYLNPEVLKKYSLEDLQNAIKILDESGLDPKSVPLMAF